MSNLIKYPFVNMAGKEAHIIDNNQQGAEFIPLNNKRSRIKTISEVEAEKALLQAAGLDHGEADGEASGEAGGEFKSGIPMTNFDKIAQEQKEKAEKKASEVLERARKEAEQIKNDAAAAVEAAKANGLEEGREQGYREGIAEAQQEIAQREQELAESVRQQQEELSLCIAGIEKKYVDIVIALLRKLTGVILEGKDDLILYLIRSAAHDMDPSESYRIRSSSEDIYFLESHKSELLDSIGENVNIEFIEEKGLENGQCIIETDSQMVDCGFQTQLDSLVQDLRMLC